jgi:DNA-binding MarR family transcriptional regulator
MRDEEEAAECVRSVCRSLQLDTLGVIVTLAMSHGPARARRAPAVEQTLYDVIRHVRPLHRYLAQVVEDGLAGTGLSVGARAVIERLAEHGPETVPQIARALLLPRQPVQRVVDAALGAGLLERETNPSHRRSVLLSLAPEGFAAFTAVKRREELALREACAGLSQAEVDACLRVIEQVTAHFRRAAGRLREGTLM